MEVSVHIHASECIQASASGQLSYANEVSKLFGLDPMSTSPQIIRSFDFNLQIPKEDCRDLDKVRHVLSSIGCDHAIITEIVSKIERLDKNLDEETFYNSVMDTITSTVTRMSQPSAKRIPSNDTFMSEIVVSHKESTRLDSLRLDSPRYDHLGTVVPCSNHQAAQHKSAAFVSTLDMIEDVPHNSASQNLDILRIPQSYAAESFVRSSVRVSRESQGHTESKLKRWHMPCCWP